jgi:kumamolisin
MPAFTRLSDSFVPFDGRRRAFRNHKLSGDLSAAEAAAEDEVTLVLRENPAGRSIDEVVEAEASLALSERHVISDADLAGEHGATNADWQKVSAWAASRGLTVVAEHSDQAARRLRVRGPIAKLDAAFGTRSKNFSWTRPLDGQTVDYRRTLTAPMLPSDVAQIVTAVQGLNQTPFEPRLVTLAPRAASSQVYTPEELARLYDFPKLANGGRGKTINIGIAELGGAVNPHVAKWFFSQPKYAHVSMTEFSVNHAPIKADPSGADIEVALDWQVVVRALVEAAPKAKINVLISYGFNSDQGFADAWNVFVTGKGVTSAKHYSHRHPAGVHMPTTDVHPTSVQGVSTSWGQFESAWSPASIKAMDQVAGAGALKGVFFANASGDNGATDGRSDGLLDADAPSLAANVLGVGGTALHSKDGKITLEEVWNQSARDEGAGGGGVSRVVPIPGYQQAAGISIPAADDGHTGRVDPDVAVNADPQTGYAVVTAINAQGHPVIETVGGTSAGTPLVTAGLALIGVIHGKKLGRVQDVLYTLAKAGHGVRDIVQGNNAYPKGTKGYPATAGFDAATGWGAPNFAALNHVWHKTVPAPSPAAPQPATPAAGGLSLD